MIMSQERAMEASLKEELVMKPTESVAAGEQHLSIDSVANRKLLRKLDLRLAPLMTLIFLCAYLDRSNIGNAASAGMIEDIGGDSGDVGSE